MEPENPATEGPEINPGSKPLFLEAASRLAREGEGAGSFLARNVQALGSSRFPGPDCLHPDELAEFRRTGRLPDARAAHMAGCDACSAMVDATQPSPERIRAFREAVAELRPAPRQLRPANAWVWAPALAAAITVVAIIGGSTLRRGGTSRTDNPVVAQTSKPTPPIGQSGSSDSGMVVTASLSGSSKMYRETPSIAVTAKPENADTVAAATAAVLSHPPNLQFTLLGRSANSQSTNSAISESATPCGKQVIVYYSNLLNQYSIDSQKGASDISAWLADYRKTPEKQAGTLNIVYKGEEKRDDAQVTCTPEGTGKGTESYVASFPIFDTLSAASSYLTKIKKLKTGNKYTFNLSPANESVPQNVSVSVKPATQPGEVLDLYDSSQPEDTQNGAAAVAIQGMWSRRTTAPADIAK